MHVIVVQLRAHAHATAIFEAALLANAAASRTEPGCLQFDVCRSADGSFYLYEVYIDPEAFQAHLQTPHFIAFNAESAPWVADKQVHVYTRVSP